MATNELTKTSQSGTKFHGFKLTALVFFSIFLISDNLLCMDNQSSLIQRRIQCNICLKTRMAKFFIKLHCGHKFCKDCLKRMICLHQEGNHINLRCPSHECEQQFNQNDFILITDRDYVPNENNIVDQYGLNVDFQRLNIKRCPECARYICRDGGCDHMTCRCGHQFCWNCLDNFHDNCCDRPARYIPLTKEEKLELRRKNILKNDLKFASVAASILCFLCYLSYFEIKCAMQSHYINQWQPNFDLLKSYNYNEIYTHYYNIDGSLEKKCVKHIVKLLNENLDFNGPRNENMADVRCQTLDQLEQQSLINYDETINFLDNLSYWTSAEKPEDHELSTRAKYNNLRIINKLREKYKCLKKEKID